MILYRPGPFLLLPGAVALVLGLALTLFVLRQEPASELRAHSLILGSMLLIIGYQTLLSGVYIAAFGKTYGVEGSGWIARILTSYHSLEKELLAGLAFLGGGGPGAGRRPPLEGAGYGSIQEMQESMMAMILVIIGIQTIFSAVFISLLLLKSGEVNGR